MYRYKYLLPKKYSDRIINDIKNNDAIILKSWITKGTLSREGNYNDRNFGDLPNILMKRNYKVCIMPMFFNVNLFSKEMRSLILKQNMPFFDTRTIFRNKGFN